jgi:LCP family protein required for cell wall assembly
MWVMDPATGSYQLRASAAEDLARPAPADPGVPASRAPGATSGVRATESASTRPVEGSRRAQRGRAASGPPDGPPPKKLRKRLKWVAISIVGVLLLGAGGVYGYYEYLNSRLKTTPKNAGTDAPKAPADAFGRRPLNILLIGSDSRLGAGNEGYGDAGHEGLADTTILMHIAADRSNATMVSIPRDIQMNIPECKVGDKKYPAKFGNFNESFGGGAGAACTALTVQKKMLGVEIDHFMVIDFKGVKEMTSAVGGVDICLNKPMKDPLKIINGKGQGTGLDLPAGPNHLAGETALQFLRSRHGYEAGSDTARIEGQKAFLMALARKIKSNASLTNVDGMLGIAKAATSNLSVDEGLGTIDKLIGLGNEIKKVPEKRLAFTTLPWEEYPKDPANKIQAKEPAATQLWAQLKADKPLTEGDPNAPAPAPSADPAPPAPPVPPVDPATISLMVQNTTTQNGLGLTVTTDLQGKKLKATAGTGKGYKKRDVSVVQYPKGKGDAARTVAMLAGLPETAIQEMTTGGTQLTLLLGTDFPKPGSVPTTPAAPPPAPSDADLKLKTADDVVCAK